MLIRLLLLLLLLPVPVLAEAPPASETGRTTWCYESPYDTAPEGVYVDAPGSYTGGVDLAPGLYTAEAAGEGVLLLSMGDEPVETYALESGAHYTVYLAEGVTLYLPEACVLRDFQRNMRFQGQGDAVNITRAQYLTMLEMPGAMYEVTGLPEGEAYVMVTLLDEGESLYLPLVPGETQLLNLQGVYDALVELVHCSVCRENGAG